MNMCINIDFISKNWDKITTIFFAGLSAFFAGITVILTYLNYKRDNSKIKASVSRGLLSYPGILFDCMICRITNIGRRQVTINQVYFSLDNKKNLFFLDNCEFIANAGIRFPFKLSERESADIDFIIEKVKLSLNENKSKLQSICFRDSTDKVYKIKIKNKKWKDLYK